MTKAKHTPGPWNNGTHPGNHNFNIVHPVLFGHRITILPECEGGHVSIKNKADAQLIAAAPELLEALELADKEIYRLSEAYEQHPEIEYNCYELGDLFERVHKAIAKAKGKL